MLQTGHLIYKCGGIDKRTIEKFEKVSLTGPIIITFLILPWPEIPTAQNPFLDVCAFAPRFCLCAPSLPYLVGEGHTNGGQQFFFLGHTQFTPRSAAIAARFPTVLGTQNTDNVANRKPLSSARAPSSMPGFLTSSRPSASAVSPSISLSGSSRPPSTTSPSSVSPPTPVHVGLTLANAPVSCRCPRPSRLHQEHDHGYLAGRLRHSHHCRRHW